MADGSRAGRAGRELLIGMIVAGALFGVLVPFITRIFVTPKSDFLWLVFHGLALIAGVSIGIVMYVVSMRSSEGLLKVLLVDASSTLGVAADETKGIDGLVAEMDHVFRRVNDLHAQSRQVAHQVRALSVDVLSATEEQASGAAEQAAAVTQTSATLEELAQTSKQIADNSEAVVSIAERTLASAEDGMTAVHDTATGIEEIRQTTQASSDRILALGERSQEIGRVLVIIDEIAEQTKILALNAAIEAARAGEAGKGFAVVAEEIRKLADSVTESTQEIGRVVREIQASTSALVMSTEKAAKKVEEGKELAHRTADALDRIVSQVEETTDAAKQISIATQQQRTASDQVVISMKEVAQVSQQAAGTSRQISTLITELNTISESLSLR